MKTSIAIVVLGLLALSPSIQAIGIDTEKGTDLELRTDILVEASVSLDDYYGGIEEPTVNLELAGDRADRRGFEISYQIGGELDTALIWLALPMNYELTIGQFKTPFGEEINLGKRSRPYPSHTVSSKALTPGLERGASIARKDLLAGRLDVEAGLFNGLGTPKDLPKSNSVLGVGKASYTFSPKPSLMVEAGYSGSYGLRYQDVYFHTLAQGLYGKLEVAPVLNRKITVFAEYLERHTASGAVNNQPVWSFGILGFASYRLDPFEFFAAFDHYRADATVSMPEDQWQLMTGVSVLPFEVIRVSLLYDAEYWPNTDVYMHKISAVTHVRF